MKNLLIFGDSYSTFQGYIPNGYATYYPKLDVHNVEETWWTRYLEQTGEKLLQNNSWSGSTIGYTGYNNTDCSKSSSFICRYKKLQEEGFFEKNKVDTIFVFGGTNDSWADAPLGEMKFSDWEDKDLFQVLSAVCYFAYRLKTDLPNTQIVFIINTDIKKEIQNAMEEAAKYFGVKYIPLQNIDKENGHPTVKGMQSIAQQIMKSV